VVDISGRGADGDDLGLDFLTPPNSLPTLPPNFSSFQQSFQKKKK
jgi:hypothetical protein